MRRIEILMIFVINFMIFKICLDKIVFIMYGLFQIVHKQKQGER